MILSNKKRAVIGMKLSAIKTALKGGRWALLALAVSFCAPRLTQASFEDLGTGARATALGGAFTPLADDIHALYYNPAGLIYTRRKQLAATYGLLHSGLGDNSKLSNSYVAYGQPIKEKWGTLGISWHQLSLQELYSERAITLGYGRKIASKWAAGLNLKHLNRSFTAPTGQTNDFGVVDTTKVDPVFASGNSKSNIGLDMGLLYKPYRNYSYGLMLQNLNEPNMAIADNDRDVLPLTLRTGIAYNERNLILLGELDTRKTLAHSRDYYFNTAAEKWWLGAGFARGDLAVRSSLGFGSRSYSQITMGMSYRIDAFQLDYGFLMPLGGISFGSSQGNHRITLTLRFGKTVSEPDYEIRVKAAETSLKEAEDELENARQESEKMARELESLKQESEKRKAEIEQTRKSVGREAAVKESSNRFADSMDRYWRRKSEGASVVERIGILNQILGEYEDSGVNLSMVRKELEFAKSDRSKAEMDLAVSWNYYQKIVARGVSIPERIQLLSRMIERFARTGVDITYLREELQALKGAK